MVLRATTSCYARHLRASSTGDAHTWTETAGGPLGGHRQQQQTWAEGPRNSQWGNSVLGATPCSAHSSFTGVARAEKETPSGLSGGRPRVRRAHGVQP